MEEKKLLLFVDKNSLPVYAGDTLLIVTSKSDRFNGTYGTMLEKKAGKALLSFSKEFASIFCGEADEKKRIALFDLSEIIKINLSEHPDLRANAVYGIRNYHHIAKRLYPFSPENLCMCGDCKELASKRIMYNVLGVVSEYDVCQAHEHFDGGSGNVEPGAEVPVLENIQQKE